LRFIPQTVLERALSVVLAEVDVDRLGIIGLDERVQTHRGGTVCPYPRRIKRFRVSAPALRLPCRSSASADAASATSVSGGSRSSMNR
jgi:hypothetical protein